MGRKALTAKDINWAEVRADYEGGMRTSLLEAKYSITYRSITKRASMEGWVRDDSGYVDKLAVLKASGVECPEGADPVTVATALDKETAMCAAGIKLDDANRVAAMVRAAEDRAAVLVRHREEWKEHLKLMETAMTTRELNDAKVAKTLAETIRIRQEGERQAWGIKDGTATDSTQVQQTLKFTWDASEKEI